MKDLPVRKEMPDAMTMDDGTKVTTVAQWRQRREEMKAILEHYELGHAPPPPGNVSGQDLKSGLLLNGTVNYRLVHLKFGPEGNPGFDIAIFTPAKSAGPFPTIINPSFFNTPGVAVTNPIAGSRRRGDEFTGAPAIYFQFAGHAGTRGRRFQQPVGSRLRNRDISLHPVRRGQRRFPRFILLSRLSGVRLGRAARLGVGTVARGGLPGDTAVRGHESSSSRWAIRGSANW